MTTAGDNIAFYLTIYGCLAGANSIFTLFRAFLFAYGGICAAQTIHRKLLSNILKVSFCYKHFHIPEFNHLKKGTCKTCFVYY